MASRSLDPYKEGTEGRGTTNCPEVKPMTLHTRECLILACGGSQLAACRRQMAGHEKVSRVVETVAGQFPK